MILVEKIHAERIARVRTALESCGLTQMIVCDPKSVWYLTGVAVEPYERLLDIMEQAGELDSRPPYGDVVNNTLAEKVSK